jgi:hypothetical protein
MNNPVMQHIAKESLERAADRIDELEAEIERLKQPRPTEKQIEMAARRLAYDAWPHAAEDERNRWAQWHWREWKERAKNALEAAEAALAT